MATAYTPGLKVSEATKVRKDRRLPLPGHVDVEVGQRVGAEDIIASTELPGSVTMVNVAAEMNVSPEEVPARMVKQPGDALKQGELLAEARAFFGMMRSESRSPVDGVLETVSPVTGQAAVRGAPTPVVLRAYIDGSVMEVHEGEGAAVETDCALVQGIFGLGGEGYGKLKRAVAEPADVLEGDAIDGGYEGAVVIGGSLVTLDAVERAQEVGASAIVVGGMEDEAVDALLGYHLGVAITGHENLGLTLVLTEGFGRIPMADRTFELLTSREGLAASVNGATQIRAGVMRPEVIIAQGAAEGGGEAEQEARLDVGRLVRVIRDPGFGLLGTVAELPPEPVRIPTESLARVVRLKLQDGQEMVVPRADVELIEQ